MPDQNTDNYNRLFTELIRKQIVVLGPDITLAKVRNIPGIEVDATGQVTKIEGDPQALLQNLINQFVELSGLIVKKTMESILTSYTASAGIQAQKALNQVQQAELQNAQAAAQPQPPQTPAAPQIQGFTQDQMSQLNQMIQEVQGTPGQVK